MSKNHLQNISKNLCFPKEVLFTFVSDYLMIDIFVCLILGFCFILILLEVIFRIQVIQLEDKLNKGNNWDCLSHIHVSPMPGSVQFSSVQSLSHVWLFAIPWTAAHQAALSNTNSRSLPELMSIASVMPSSHLILCCPLLLTPSIFPSIRVF